MTNRPDSTDARERLQDWWRTDLVDIGSGIIRIAGYPIEELIGRLGIGGIAWLLLRGELPTPVQESLLEAAIVAGVSHGPRAPSIAIAQMAMTCGVGINNAMASGINALGDVHGGAGQQAMELYARIRQRMQAGETQDEAVVAEVDAELESTAYIPGFGHRVHAVDPRVAPLLDCLEDARTKQAIEGRFVEIGKAVGKELSDRKGRHITMNIDGITAIVYAELGLAPVVGRGLFVLSRSIGIMAHAWEQQQRNERIKGPMPPGFQSTYVGAAPRSAGHLDRRLGKSATPGKPGQEM